VDFTWDYAVPGYWTTIETNFAIICACVMTLRPLIAKLFPGLTEERLSSGDGEDCIGGTPQTIGTKPMRTPPGHQETSIDGSLDIDLDGDISGEAGQDRIARAPKRMDEKIYGL
jgi:hypothetical protein